MAVKLTHKKNARRYRRESAAACVNTYELFYKSKSGPAFVMHYFLRITNDFAATLAGTATSVGVPEDTSTDFE